MTKEVAIPAVTDVRVTRLPSLLVERARIGVTIVLVTILAHHNARTFHKPAAPEAYWRFSSVLVSADPLEDELENASATRLQVAGRICTHPTPRSHSFGPNTKPFCM